MAEIAGAKLTDEVKAQVEGRSLVPLLRDPKAEWPDRILFTHVGRWPKGAKPADHKYAHCSVRSPRWHLVCDAKDGKKQWQLFDVKADPGEKTDVADKHPEVVKELDAAYDKWWDVGAAGHGERGRGRAEGQPVQGTVREAVWRQVEVTT